MLDKFNFFQPEEVVRAELEIIKALLSEAFTWGEIRQMHQ